MRVKEFRFVRVSDPCDRERWDNWSRAYEYPLVLRALLQLQSRQEERLRVHNTGCGGSPLHTAFASEIDRFYEVVNSDMEPVVLPQYPKWPWVPKYRRYNLLDPYPSNHCFDAVLSISTLEHIEREHTYSILNHLVMQVKPGGRLLITVDVPSAGVLDKLETYFEESCSAMLDELTPFNSVYPSREHSPSRVAWLEVEP